MTHLLVSYCSAGETQSTQMVLHNGTIKSSTGFSCSSCARDKSMLLAEEHLSRKENEYYTSQVGLLAFDMMSKMNTCAGNFQDNRYCMHVVVRYSCKRETSGETIVRTQTNATKKTHLHEGRMIGHYSSMVRWSANDRQSRQKDVTHEPPASDSTSDRFWRQQTVLALLPLLSKSP